VALAILAAGGATFAATGGVSKVKSWLRVRIDINGDISETALDENGEGTFTVETEDGGTATVQVKRLADGENAEMTQIDLSMMADEVDSDAQRVIEMEAIISGTADDQIEYSLEDQDLEGAEPVAEWTDPDGRTYELYILPGEDGVGSRVVWVNTQDGEATVALIATADFPLLGEGLEPEIEINDDGLVTITLDDGEGNVEVIEAGTAPGMIEPEAMGEMLLESPDGAIQVTITPIEEEE
jgi:hypothetical protein